eukprot:GHVU01021905.1.p3 GENE.GHVU01021905.1~~GHVU01021905.1.p3  ORF type:complete len:110 (+),score=3.04 GHVU01021905.1:120-449(+)
MLQTRYRCCFASAALAAAATRFPGPGETLPLQHTSCCRPYSRPAHETSDYRHAALRTAHNQTHTRIRTPPHTHPYICIHTDTHEATHTYIFIRTRTCRHAHTVTDRDMG